MSWQIEEYQFDPDRKLLILGQKQIVLEPKAAAMLAYFCAHPNHNISRDELMATVWQGQVVTDNAINRVIVQLRKALADEDQVKQFITTVPKIGYRFIARVEPLAETPRRSSSGPKMGMLLTALAVAVLVVLYVSQQQKEQPATTSQSAAITPLTRLSESQYDAVLSYAGDRLLYTSTSSSTAEQAVFVLDMETQLPVRISQTGGDAFYAEWAHDDSFLIYLFLTSDACEFHRVDFIEKVAQTPEVIYQCPAVMETNFALSQDNRTLYFVEQEADFEPYKAYALDLVDNNKRQLSQPTMSGLGNHYLDHHPLTGDLLLLNNPKPGFTSVYILDTQQNSFTLKHDFEYSIYSAIWGVRENTIVHPAQHPSYQLLETDLNSGESRVLLSDSRRISGPGRIHNTDDYLFTSYLYNRDIVVEGMDDTNINSTVMDYLPALSPDGTTLAFVSKRSGYSKIWLKNLNTGELSSIEPPDQGRWFYSLHWSFDGNRILANTSSGLIEFSLASGQIVAMLSPDLPVFSASWFNQTEWVYSVYENKRWQAYRYNPTSQETTALAPRWSFVKANPAQSVYLDQQFNMYIDGSELVEDFDCAGPILWRYSVGIILDAENIHCVAADAATDLLTWHAQAGLLRTQDFLEPGAYFSAAAGVKVKTVMATQQSDIMRTNFTKP